MLVRIILDSPYNNHVTLHVVADSITKAIEWAEQNTAFDVANCRIGQSEIENPEQISAIEFTRFANAFHTGAYNNQRFGQAFINTYAKAYPLVDAHHYAGLWDIHDTNQAIHYIEQHGIIDFQKWVD